MHACECSNCSLSETGIEDAFRVIGGMRSWNRVCASSESIKVFVVGKIVAWMCKCIQRIEVYLLFLCAVLMFVVNKCCA